MNGEAPHDRKDRARRITAVLLVVCVALVLRAYYFHEFRLSPYYEHLAIDAEGYDQQGWKIAQGNWLGKEIFFQDPLYPYFLGVIYRIFGHQYVVVYLLQALMGCALCVMVMMLAERVFASSRNRHRIALVSGLLCATATPLVFYEFLILKTSLGVFLTAAHLLALASLSSAAGDEEEALRPRARRLVLGSLASGALLGLNILNRGNYLLLAPVFTIWLAWHFRSGRYRRPRGSSLPAGVLVFVIYTLGTLAVVLPVTARNYVVSGEWVLVTAHGGVNFYIGNNEHNTTGFYDVPAGVRAHPELQMKDFQVIAERETGRKLTLVEVDRYLLDQARKWISENPSDALSLYFKKWAMWLAGFEPSNNYSFDFVKANFSHALKLPISTAYTFGMLGWTALLIALLCWRSDGGVLSPSRHPNLVLLGLFLLSYSCSITLFFILSRYRAPLYPVLIILSAALITWVLADWSRQTLRLRILGIAGFVLVATAVWRPVWQPGWWLFGRVVEGTQYFNVGAIYMEKGDLRQALEYFDRSASTLGSNHRDVLMEITRIYTRSDREEDARAILKRLLDKDPGDADAWYQLGLISRAAGLQDDAEAAFRKVRELAPDKVEAYYPAAAR